MAQLVKNPPAIREAWVPPLGWGDHLEKGKAAHSRIRAWRSPCAVHGVATERLSPSLRPPLRGQPEVLSCTLDACLALFDPTDCSPPGSSVHGILQARTLECIAIPFSRVSSPPRDRTESLTTPPSAGGFFTMSTTWAAQACWMQRTKARPCVQRGWSTAGRAGRASWLCR